MSSELIFWTETKGLVFSGLSY